MTGPNDPNQPEQGAPQAPPPQASPPAPPSAAPPPGYQPAPAYSTPPTGSPQAPPPGYPAAPPMQAGYGYGQSGIAAPPGMYVDPASGLTIPNGVQLASVGRRIGAYFLAIPLFVVTLGIGYIIWGLMLWGRGQTPTYKVLGMRVWRPAEQRPASFGYMALREIVGRIVDGILGVITGLISFVLMLTGKERKTLHDMVAGTVALHDPNKVIPER